CPSCQFNILESNFGRVGKGLFFEVAFFFLYREMITHHFTFESQIAGCCAGFRPTVSLLSLLLVQAILPVALYVWQNAQVRCPPRPVGASVGG
ncbi:MAG: hypothetical protein V7679_14945, partial [Parasphingorhabdus sp.]